MKIGIVSDTHGYVDTWKQLFSRYFADADLIIHAGDVLYHGPRNKIPGEYDPMALAEEINNCRVPVIIACGNCDAEIDSMVIEFPVQAPYAYLVVNGLRIVVNHGHHLDDHSQYEMAVRMKAGLFITGHTHLARLEKRGNIVLLNPGSPAMSKRDDKRGTIALLQDNCLEILAVNSGEILARQQL